jgi:CheY-like chemotaxis protein
VSSESRSRRKTPSKARPLVLVADDFSGAREVYARLLAASGYRVVEAASGEEAVTKALELAPQLILMDLLMPGVDGWEAIRRLRADPRTSAVAIVVITAVTEGKQAPALKQIGCDAYLLKPTPPETLLEVVRTLLVERAAG